MKFRFILAALILFFAARASAQCERTMGMLSPQFYKYGNGNVGVGIEAGLLPVDSKTFVTLKGALWTQSVKGKTTDYKGRTETYTEVRNQGFVGLKLNFVPHAYESLSRKWAFGAAAGFYAETGKEGRPAMELSSACVIRMAAESYSGGVGYLKLEGLCLLTPTGVKPGLSAGVFLLL